MGKDKKETKETKYALIRELKEIDDIICIDNLFDYFIKNKEIKGREFFVVKVYTDLEEAQKALSQCKCTVKTVKRFDRDALDCVFNYIEYREYVGKDFRATGEYQAASFYDLDIDDINNIADKLLESGVVVPDDITAYINEHKKGNEFQKALYKAIDNSESIERCTACGKMFFKSKLKIMLVDGVNMIDSKGIQRRYCERCFDEIKKTLYEEVRDVYTNSGIPCEDPVIEEVPLVR